MAKSPLFFSSLFLTVGVSSCFSTVERPLLKSNVDNSVDIVDYNVYTSEPSSYSFSKKTKYTVSFYSRVGNTELCIATRTVVEGEKVSPPEDFDNPGATFVGWFLDKNYKNLFDFDDGIYSDIEIYAKWEGASKAIDFYYSTNNDATCTLIAYRGTNSEIRIPSTYKASDTGIEYTVTKIGPDAFNSNNTITKVIVPSTVKVIDERAFSNCTYLDSIYLPSKLERIGADAFEKCLTLRNVYYANTIYKWATIIFDKSKTGSYIFNVRNTWYSGGETILRTLNAEPTNPNLDSSSYSYAAISQGVTFSSSSGLTSCTDYCFLGLDQLKNVSITSNTFISIGKYAFAYCSNLESFNINITGTTKTKNKKLCEGAFYRCSSLSEVTNSNFIAELSPYCFYLCGSLEEFNFNNDMLYVPSYAFYSTGLKRISFPAGQYKVEAFGRYTFANCKQLKEVGFRRLKFIEYRTFESSYNMEKVYYEGSINEFRGKVNSGIYNVGYSAMASLIDG